MIFSITRLGTLMLLAALSLNAVMGCAITAGNDKGATVMLSPSSMPWVGTIDERFQSYNVEMLEVTGGKFWKPYDSGVNFSASHGQAPATQNPGDTPAGMNPDAYAYRPPIDLANPRRRKLAAALGPAYVRVSGTWANTSYFADSELPPARAPAGFSGVVSQHQWKGVVDFAHVVDAKIVTSFATSPGTRNSAGVWTPDAARRLLNYTRSIGGEITAAEFMNEPTMAIMGGAPAGYDAAAYGRDFKVFRAFIKQAAPDMIILGPGSVGETDGAWGVTYGVAGMIKTSDMLSASRPAHVNAFSYHHYGASSQRCAGMGMGGTTPDAALSEAWLGRTDQTLSFYRRLRDQYEPGKPLWLTETADAACGGNPWASTFLDTFRYLDQNGRLAMQGVQVVMHNTLDASDYGLLDENTLEPRPNYWAALLWRKFMGPTVLDSGAPAVQGLHIYAHSLRHQRGGVALLILNTDRALSQTLSISVAGKQYTLSAEKPQSKRVRLNGVALQLGPNDEIPELKGSAVSAGKIILAPETITFLTLPLASNPACH